MLTGHLGNIGTLMCWCIPYWCHLNTLVIQGYLGELEHCCVGVILMHLGKAGANWAPWTSKKS